jgi:hypothetical protein
MQEVQKLEAQNAILEAASKKSFKFKDAETSTCQDTHD